MKDDKEIIILKLIAVGATIYYLYRSTKKAGVPMAALPPHLQPNPDQIVNLASKLLPNEWRGPARQFGSELLKRAIEPGRVYENGL